MARILPIPISDQMLAVLRLSANRAMWQEWHAAGLCQPPVHEVPCIRNLIHRALPAVQAAWQKQLKGINITASLRGIVCHGQPRVRYRGAPRACELGDFLLVHDHTSTKGPMERTAAIVQAKVFHTPAGVTSKNDVQLNLYKTWPRFTYTDWPGGIGKLQSLLAKEVGVPVGTSNALQRELAITPSGAPTPSSALIEKGCRYGMIDVQHSRWGDPVTSMNPWRLCSPNAHNLYRSQDGQTLGGYLTRLMRGEVGRAVPDTGWPSGLAAACHWSLMIKELLSLLPPALPAAPANVLSLTVLPDAGGKGGMPHKPANLTEHSDPSAFAVLLVTTNGGPGADDRRSGPG
jgi:hypothetical protein